MDRQHHGISTPTLLLLIGGGMCLAMFAICCGGCLLIPSVRTAYDARLSSEQRAANAARQQQADTEFKVSMLARRGQDELRTLLKFPSTARFEHPTGQGFPLPTYEARVSKELVSIRGTVFAKNSLGLEGGHTYELIYRVPGGDFSRAQLTEYTWDGTRVLRGE